MFEKRKCYKIAEKCSRYLFMFDISECERNKKKRKSERNAECRLRSIEKVLCNFTKNETINDFV